MTNFDLQLNAAINTYSAISGIARADVIAACADFSSQTTKNVTLLMAAAA